MNDTKEALTPLADEVADDVVLAKAIAADAKTIGWKAALTKHAPEVIKEVKEDITAFKAAAPALKAGYQSTEFWLVALVILANAIVPIFTGKPIPFDANLAITVVVGIYTGVRGLIKAKQP